MANSIEKPNSIKLLQGIDTKLIVDELNANCEWGSNPVRKLISHSPHRMVEDIILRGDVPKGDSTFWDHKECISYPDWYKCELTQELIFSVMKLVKGTRLGRCIVAKLPDQEVILPHKDIMEGYHYDKHKYYDRFHVCLEADAGVDFNIGDQTFQMVTGDLWWINNREEHSVVNRSGKDRIHLIIDIKGE